jgi:hypothetical protein
MRSQDVPSRSRSAAGRIARRLPPVGAALLALVAAAEIGAPRGVASSAPAPAITGTQRVVGQGPPRAEGEVSTRRLPRLDARHAPRSRRPAIRRPPIRKERIRPTGQLRVVSGTSGVAGRGPVKTFLVEVEKGLRIDGRAFATTVQQILFDERGWAAGDRLAFKRVDSGPVDFRIALSSPRTTNRLCAPLETAGRYSCHQNARAVLNYKRWQLGAQAYGPNLRGYRTYLVNHEVGHALGHAWHRSCPGPGARAPVMMQQTLGVGECRPHAWPLSEERESVL